MFKKTAITALLLATMTLAACGQSASTTTDPDTGSKSSTSKSESSSSKISEEAATSSAQSSNLRVGEQDDEQQLLTQSIDWKNFRLNTIKGEIDDNKLELEMDWTNRTTESAKFSSLGKIQVFQEDKELDLLAGDDDDFNEDVAADSSEDADISFNLINTNSQIVIKITTADGDEPHVVNVKLE